MPTRHLTALLVLTTATSIISGCSDDGSATPASSGQVRASADRANALVPADAGVTFVVREVVDDDGTVIASTPVPDGWAADDLSGFTFGAPSTDGSGAVTGLVIENNCYGQCSPKDWSSELRAPGELIDRRLAAGAAELPVEGSDGVVLRWEESGASKAQVLRWADDASSMFSCLVVVADRDLALLESLVMACVTAVPAHLTVA